MTTTAPRPGEEDTYVGEEMPLVEHLRELRTRLVRAALGIAFGLGIGFVFRDRILDVLKGPYCDLPSQLRGTTALGVPGECSLIVTDVLSPLFISLKAAGIVAVVIGGPIACYQLWRFVTPGLRPVERRYSVPFIVMSQVLFAAGAVFSFQLIPRALEFLLGFLGPGIVSVMDANRYITFVLQTTIAFGLSFEFPLVLIILALMGIVTASGLRKARRYAIFGVFVAAAVITPTQDPVTMSFMAGPLIVFYEASVLAAWLIERRRARAEVAESS